MIDNEVRQNITRLLRRYPGLNYSDFLEEDMDSSKLAYHINMLKENDFIVKKGEKYYLTDKGQQKVGYLNKKSETKAKQPLQVALVAIVQDGKLLLQKRKREPFHGIYGVPSGKMEFGETALQTAKRELKEETGLEADLTFKGLVHIITKENNQTVWHHNMHVFKGENIRGKLVKETDEGTNEWVELSKLKNIPCFSTVPMWVEITQGDHFVFRDIDNFPHPEKNDGSYAYTVQNELKFTPV